MSREERIALLAGRTSGERAFDRILLAMISYYFTFPRVKIALPSPSSFSWENALFALGLILFWIWLGWELGRSWCDPVAKVLRFSPLLLLLSGAGFTLAVLKDQVRLSSQIRPAVEIELSRSN